MTLCLTLLALRASAVLAAPQFLLNARQTDVLIPSSLSTESQALLAVRNPITAASADAAQVNLVQVASPHLRPRGIQHTTSDLPAGVPPPKIETIDLDPPHVIQKLDSRHIKKEAEKSLPNGVSAPRLLTGGDRSLESDNQPHVISGRSLFKPISDAFEFVKRHIQKTLEPALPEGVSDMRIEDNGEEMLGPNNEPHLVTDKDSDANDIPPGNFEKRRIKKTSSGSNLPSGVSAPRLLTGGSRTLESNNQPHVVGRTLASLLDIPAKV